MRKYFIELVFEHILSIGITPVKTSLERVDLLCKFLTFMRNIFFDVGIDIDVSRIIRLISVCRDSKRIRRKFRRILDSLKSTSTDRGLSIFTYYLFTIHSSLRKL